jgi:hypothetical protein
MTMTREERLATSVFNKLVRAVAQIDRALTAEYARTPAEEFLSPEFEQIRRLNCEIVQLVDQYSHLTGE